MLLCHVPPHPCVVQARGLVEGNTPDKLYLAMEMLQGTLQQALHDRRDRDDDAPGTAGGDESGGSDGPGPPRGLPLAVARAVVRSVAEGLAHVHACGVVHRDLKTSNLLYSAKGDVKLADFGLAVRWETSGGEGSADAHEGGGEGNRGPAASSPSGAPAASASPPYSGSVPHEAEVVTLWYRAPELLLGAPRYTAAIDCWSLGCVMAEVLLGEPLLTGGSELVQLDAILGLLGMPGAEAWPEFKTLPGASSGCFAFPPRPGRLEAHLRAHPGLDPAFFADPDDARNGLALLTGLLTHDSHRRLTARDALDHPWLSPALCASHDAVQRHLY